MDEERSIPVVRRAHCGCSSTLEFVFLLSCLLLSNFHAQLHRSSFGIEALSGGDRHQIVVHVDVDTLREHTAGCCELEDGPSMAAETARRLACDATVVTLIENGEGEPLNVGRATRTISPALRRLLKARDKGCRFPGCTHTRVDAHHIHHWANGGETKPSNLVSLCKWHHRCLHEGGFQIQVLDDGVLRFLRPDGRTIDSVAHGHTVPLGDWEHVPSHNRVRGLAIGPTTATTRWAGERMDYGLGVDSLLHEWRRRRSQDAQNGGTAESHDAGGTVAGTWATVAPPRLSWNVLTGEEAIHLDDPCLD